MNVRETIQSWGLGMLLVMLLLWSSTLQAAVPSAWKEGGFSINANGMTVRGVLDEFSRTYGVRLQLSAEGGQIVKGRLKAENGVEFLNRLTSANKMRWFVYNDTLYVVSATDNTSQRMQVGEDAVMDAKTALVGLGLFDERFGWGELPDEGVVIVSGPRAYVDLAREVLMPAGAKKEKLRGRQVMLFRLKYASANDRVINTRGKPETIPGIKTILTNLLMGGHGSGGEKVTGNNRFDVDSRKRSRSGKINRAEPGDGQESGERFSPLFSAPGANGRNNLMAPGAGQAASPGGYDNTSGAGGAQDGEGKQQGPRIEADSTLNAIMIYDDIAKKSVYESLIAQLDIKPQQIEIEALIVDIDRSRLAEMGVEWGARAGVVNTTVNGTTTQSSGTDLPLPGATLLISDAARFYARLKAMESNGEARVLATPTVLTLDNVAAVLDLSQSAYVSLVGERVADMSDITAGTMLRVIPRIINDAGETRVRLEVDIEDGSLNNTESDSSRSTNNNGSGTIAANVTRSTINTQAIIDAQQTLMIGGYRAESLIRNKQKVPVLGDLPVVGGLFRSESRSNSTRERLFLITPRITGFDGTRLALNKARGNATPAAPAPSQPGMPAPGMPSVPVPGPMPNSQVLPAPADAATSSGTPPALLPLPANAPGATPRPPSSDPQQASNMPHEGSLMGVHLPLRKTKNRCLRPGAVGIM
ncbi:MULTISPECIES: type III secretion system outer membrane ring subunit SctC [unclassified Herbaspirillum]|uniref:type III secretion system outer membrane ring subunit SctC n=1 Tax=unclassified Herbaspirillum TaxID=2624150 RepID=UPI001151898C|nr:MULTISPECIES: type III secretion system outer membrane ring subunit SctC [unclassified Herbaspirillum]MBB5391340.1 type III secretion protein C [Herbaspirillum sp. SJZ102]TQK12973.1 type III secretion protein C [Herbaspirillum sp. SJZ130]TQK14977.1 type III secretion protein C [Herbaspirillum sp. SJZ106]